MSKERHPVAVRNDIIEILESTSLIVPITKEQVKDKHSRLRKLFKEYIRADKERYSNEYFDKQKKVMSRSLQNLYESPF